MRWIAVFSVLSAAALGPLCGCTAVGVAASATAGAAGVATDVVGGAADVVFFAPDGDGRAAGP